MKHEPYFDADKIFFITRNPIDVLPSFFLMYNTGSHSFTCKENIAEAFPQEWDTHIKRFVPHFKQWHELCIQQITTGTPHFFTRFEDTTNDSKTILTDLFKFMLNQPTLAGTVLEKRINETTFQSFEKRASYGLKSTVTLNRNIHLYNEEQIEFIKTELRDFLHYFGYVDHPSNPDNLTPFFVYKN